MDKRFVEIKPQVSKQYGPEPSLYDMIVHYYNSHGINYSMAQNLAEEYTTKWVKEEDKLK